MAMRKLLKSPEEGGSKKGIWKKEGNNLFQVNLKGMIALLSEHIYSNPNTFVRELLQNCVDAITALRNIDENYKGRIDVFLNEDKTVVFPG